MVMGNGSNHAVCLGFGMIRGSPLWLAYQADDINSAELTIVLNWMAKLNRELWQKLSHQQAKVAKQQQEQFEATITTTKLWRALEKEQITIQEFLEEIQCPKARQLTSREEQSLIEFALKALEN